MKTILRKLLVAILFFSAITSYGQNQTSKIDTKAKKILDELSVKTKQYKTIVSEFIILAENKVAKTKDVQKGKIWIKGAKYKLDIANQVIINDSKTIYTVLKDAEEVQINNADEKKSEDQISPANIFTIYEKGFKYEFVKEEKLKDGTTSIQVKLFPNEPKKKNFHTLILNIDKAKNQVSSFVILGKDGTQTTYSIKNFTANSNLGDDIFAFNTKIYPKYEIIDLR
jgi:outer membrane lipoprotein-sorting protein